jgi:hypothetical protein
MKNKGRIDPFNLDAMALEFQRICQDATNWMRSVDFSALPPPRGVGRPSLYFTQLAKFQQLVIGGMRRKEARRRVLEEILDLEKRENVSRALRKWRP